MSVTIANPVCYSSLPSVQMSKLPGWPRSGAAAEQMYLAMTGGPHCCYDSLQRLLASPRFRLHVSLPHR